MEPFTLSILCAVVVAVLYVAWRAVDTARHDIVITHDDLRWRIDLKRMHARVQALPGHHAGGGERNYQLARRARGEWEMRMSDSSRWTMLDGAGRAMPEASDKQRLEIREEVEMVLHDTSWHPVPRPVARRLESERARPRGTELARSGSRII
jgi:hypothetical protein